MDRHWAVIAFSGALLAPGHSFADAVEISGGGLSVPEAAIGSSYFGLKGQGDLFARLREKIMQYWTPDLNGFRAGVGYAEDRGSLKFAPAGNYAFSLSYDYGRVSAYIENDRGLGYGLGRTRTRTDLGAMYEIDKGTRFGVGFEQRGYDFAAGYGRSMKLGDWHVSLDQDVWKGGHLRVSFAQADRSEFLSGGNQLSLGYGQFVSKQTEIYALYSRSRNPDNFSLGSSPNEFGLGVKVNF